MKQTERTPMLKTRRMMFTIFTLQTYLILMSVIMGKLGSMPLTGLKKTNQEQMHRIEVCTYFYTTNDIPTNICLCIRICSNRFVDFIKPRLFMQRICAFYVASSFCIFNFFI